MHTINLERLATVVTTQVRDGVTWAMPDTLIGTDSHTPMINGIGVLAWGVGGLEAESVMFGMPVMLRVPDVVGVRLTGALPEGTLATDLALGRDRTPASIAAVRQVRRVLRPGCLARLSCGERAVVANMAPEYGASTGYFPIDLRTIEYLLATGRSRAHVQLVERYARRQHLWFDPAVRASLHRSARDRSLDKCKCRSPDLDGRRIGSRRTMRRRHCRSVRRRPPAPQRIVAIAAITSCTNTSDARLAIAAGLLASKARAFGLHPPAWVKTSFAPGSPTAARYLRRAGLLDDMEALGFGIVGYGCTTCIGNSGPLHADMLEAMARSEVQPVAVLSGNRNFPGRVHPQIDANFLASPPLGRRLRACR